MVKIDTSAAKRRAIQGQSSGRVAVVEPYILPFTILHSNEEQLPWLFGGLQSDADKKYAPIVVKVVRTHLKTGDYTIESLKEKFTIERKSVSDLYGTLSGGPQNPRRERFQREHERMAAIVAGGGRAFVVIEGDLAKSSAAPPSGMSPKSVRRTMVSWMYRYGVPWIWAGDRPMAETLAFDLMCKFWQEKNIKE